MWAFSKKFPLRLSESINQVERKYSELLAGTQFKNVLLGEKTTKSNMFNALAIHKVSIECSSFKTKMMLNCKMVK
jgi:hypothetical protein